MNTKTLHPVRTDAMTARDSIFHVSQELLDNCSGEPIHIPGSIQGFGALLVFDNDGIVRQVSINASDITGCSTNELLGTPIPRIIPGTLGTRLVDETLALPPGFRRWLVTIDAIGGNRDQPLDVYVHRHDGCNIIELIPAPPGHADLESLLRMQEATNRLSRIASQSAVLDFCDKVSRELRHLTDYDRVMIYRFDHDWNGQVIAESRSECLEPYLGLWYPSTDIPEQARSLYYLNRVRVLADVSSEPVALLPLHNPNTGRMLDLSYSLLRSFSPVHREYLTNMGVRATLVASIIREEVLWGLIACHHYTPRHCSPHVLTLADTCASLISTNAVLDREREQSQGVVRVETALASVAQIEFDQATSPSSLVSEKVRLLEALAANGIAVVYRGRCTVNGKVPTDERILDLTRWLDAQGAPFFSTECLSEQVPEFADIAATSSGVMAISFPGDEPTWLIWFREEITTSVRWAGDPRKAINLAASGRLTPRKSFEIWLEQRQAHSQPWSELEVFLAEKVVRPRLLESLATMWGRRAKNLKPYHEIVLSQVSDAVVVVDVRGCFTFWNEGAKHVFGFLAEEVLGKRFEDILAPVEQRTASQLWHQLRRGQHFDNDFLFTRKDGTKRRINGRIQAIFDEDGKPIGAVGLYRDVTELRRSERALRLAQTVINQMQEGIIVTEANDADPDGPTIVFVNAALEQLTGYSREELIGKTPRLLQGERTDPTITQQIRATLAARGSIRVEVINHRKDGSHYWVELDISPVRSRENTVTHFVALQRDVTERRLSEIALQEKESFLRRVIDLMPGFVIVKDTCSRFVLVNQNLADAYGVTADELIGKTHADYNPDPQEVSAMRESDRKVFQSKEALPRYEEKFTDIAGRTRWFLSTKVPLIEKDGKCTKLLKVAKDITDLKITLEAMREREQQFQLMANSIQDIIVMANSDGTCLYISPSCRHLLGIEPMEAIGRDCRQWVHPEDHDLFAKKYSAGLLPPIHMECRVQHRSGHYVWMEVVISQASAADGLIDRFVCSLRDISARKEIEEHIRRTNKLEAIGRLAGGIAHDFNNILTVVIGYADLLRSDLQESPMWTLAEQILVTGQRGASLTRQLLAFARGQPLTLENVDVNDVVTSMDSMLHRLIGERIEYVVDLEPGLPQVYVDRSQLEQVVMNLVINAADAMPQGGTLTVSSSTDDGGTVTEKGEFVCLTVSDTGTGMDADTMSRLFEPFFTTKAIGKGTGLGLATVYGAIKRFGGDIRVESEMHQGSRFHVYLPRSTHDRGQTEEVVGTESDRNHGAGHILVVEDDSGIAEMVLYILRNVGYRVDVVGTGLEALDFLKQQSALPDLILSDVMLPHMKGPELSREAHVLYGEIRIAYMSGYRDLQAVDVRPDDGEVLAKPFTRDELLQFVRRQLIPGNS